MAKLPPELKSEQEQKSESIIPTDRALLYKQLDEQYHMGWEEARGLIRSDLPLLERIVKVAIHTARTFGLPLQGINVITNSKGVSNIYVNADGVRWRLHLDPRHLKSVTCEVVHRPSTQEPWVEANATIEFMDESHFENIGVVDCLPGPGVGNAVMKSVTKAQRRAGVTAVGVALPIFEDYVEWLGEQRQAGKYVDAIDVEFHEAQQKSIVEPKNLSELLVWVDQVGHTTDEAVQIAGEYAVMAQDVPATVKKLKEVWNVT